MIISKRIKKYILALITMIALILVIKVFFFDIISIKEINTDVEKKVLILKKHSFEVGDLVLYETLDSDNYHVSRIVALENDSVYIQNGVLFVNNKVVVSGRVPKISEIKEFLTL